MIERASLQSAVRQALARNRVVALVGPRQVGKTTLARRFVEPGSANYFDLEDPVSLARLAEPMTALAGLQGLVVIDEIQRAPALFPVMRVLADREPARASFLILGSASPALLRESGESLAGRIEVIEVGGFSLDELGAGEADKLWLRGGFPRSFLAARAADSAAWRKQFLIALVQRDLPQLGITLPAPAMTRFLTMLAHCHGQVWNAADPARSLGISETTVRRYLDILAGTFLVRVLPPWHENLGKRQIKSPKIYWRDTGLLHQLLGIGDREALLSHPKCGASWEGFVLEALHKALAPDETCFWGTHTGAELDGLFIRDGRRLGIEIKRADAPRMTPSMRHALHDLRLDWLWVIYPGSQAYALDERVRVMPLADAIGLPAQAA